MITSTCMILFVLWWFQFHLFFITSGLMLIMYRHKQSPDMNLLDRKKCFQINRSSATEQMFRTFFAKKYRLCCYYCSLHFLQLSSKKPIIQIVTCAGFQRILRFPWYEHKYKKVWMNIRKLKMIWKGIGLSSINLL